MYVYIYLYMKLNYRYYLVLLNDALSWHDALHVLKYNDDGRYTFLKCLTQKYKQEPDVITNTCL